MITKLFECNKVKFDQNNGAVWENLLKITYIYFAVIALNSENGFWVKLNFKLNLQRIGYFLNQLSLFKVSL